MELLKSLVTLWVWKETRQAWTMFSKLKALIGLKKILSYHFQYRVFTSKHGFIRKVKFQVIVFRYRAKIDNSEWSLPSTSMYHRKIPTYTYRFCPVHKAVTWNSSGFSELLPWQDTQSFDIWEISPRLEVLPLTQKYQTQQKDFDSKMPDDASVCIVLRLNQVTLQPQFNLNNVTLIFTSIIFDYFGGDLKYE